MDMAQTYKRYAKYQRTVIKVSLKDKKLLKSSRVRKWIKHINEVLEKQVNTPEYKAKIAESVALGLPIILFSDGHIEVMNPYKKKLLLTSLTSPSRKWFNLTLKKRRK